MSLRIVYGRAGTGKSYFCYNEIKKKIHNKKKIYIITPEQFSFTAEKKLMEVLESNSVMSAEVLTFGRMAYRIMQEVGGKTKIPLSSVGKAILLYSILDKKKQELTFLGKTDKNVDVIATLITELKKHNITVEAIRDSMEDIKDPYLQYKMKDILILYQAFENEIQENYIDENDALTILAEQLEKTNLFQDAIFYIDEFVGFTPQEYRIITRLLNLASQVTVTVCADKLPMEKPYIPEADIFYSNRATKHRLIDIAKNYHIDIEEDVYLEETHRYHNPELQHLEESIYENRYHKFLDKPEHIHLFLASNPYAEIEQVAKSIVELVRQQQYRYKDIAIITKNVGTYSSLAKAIFAQYEIPVFMDEKKDLSENILVKYILSLLEIFSKHWSHEAMFSFIKNGLSGIERKDRIFFGKLLFKMGNY